MAENCVEVTVRVVPDPHGGNPTIGIGGAYLGETGVVGLPDPYTIVRVLLMGLSVATDAQKGQLQPPPKVLRTTAEALTQINGHRGRRTR